MDPKALEDIKDQMLDNMDILMTKIDICTESGMLDEDSSLHNQVYGLREDTDEVETALELGEIINRCKPVEITLDRFLSAKGQTTIVLTWPDVEEPEE